MKTIRIDKRIPFGFKGEWGKLYKHYNYDENVQNVVMWQKSSYYDIGQDVQFKLMEHSVDKQQFPTQPVENAIVKSDYRMVETTDAYFDVKKGRYFCVAEIGDIVFFAGEWWVVDSVEMQNIYNPKPQTFYFIALKRIHEEIVITEKE